MTEKEKLKEKLIKEGREFKEETFKIETDDAIYEYDYSEKLEYTIEKVRK